MGFPHENGLANPEISPDGRRVAADRTVTGNTDLSIIDATRATGFTFDSAIDNAPLWSPDGRRIVFRSNRTGPFNLYEKPSSGAADERVLFESPQNKVPNDWSPDGKFIVFASADPKTSWDLWLLPLEGDTKPQVFLRTNFEEYWAQFAPDGRWIAYQSTESGQFEIFVRSFSGAGGQWQVSTGGGIMPRWRSDGRELFYLTPDGQLMAVSIATRGATLEPGRPVALFQAKVAVGVGMRQQYNVAPDGHFLLNVPAGTQRIRSRCC